MKSSPSSTLLSALRLQRLYDADTTHRKRVLLQMLEKTSLRTAPEVVRLHDLLCFLRAYPDNKSILSLVERMLADFANTKRSGPSPENPLRLGYRGH